MKKDLKQHLIYGSVLLIIVALLLFYQSYRLTQTEQLFTQQISQLANRLGETNTMVEQLQGKTQTLTAQVQDLDSSLQEKGQDIQDLGGELAEVKTLNEQQVQQLQDSISKIKTQYQDFSDVIDQSVKAVVSVQTNAGSGSGFIFNSHGYIVTNYHVIQGAQSARVVTHDGISHKVYLVGSDSAADIAVLWINETNLDYLRFGNSDEVRVGEKVIAIGNPGGLDFTVTQGIVSAVNREDSKGNELIQIDVPINPGNSGGPLIDASGKVIGVNTLKIAGFEGVGFAIAANEVTVVAQKILER